MLKQPVQHPRDVLYQLLPVLLAELSCVSHPQEVKLPSQPDMRCLVALVSIATPTDCRCWLGLPALFGKPSACSHSL